MKVAMYLLIGLIVGGGAVYFFMPKPERNAVIGQFKFTSSVSGPVSFSRAVAMHKMYMTDCWYAGEDTTKVSLRYLRIDKKDIDRLSANMPAGGGFRIYFGDTRAPEQMALLPGLLTTFLVAVDGTGQLMIKNGLATPNVAQGDIVDNLPPCPDNCPGQGDNPPKGDGFN